MSSPATDDTEQRRMLLEAWVEKRRQIAALEAEAAELLVARIAIRDADVVEHPFHRDAIYRSMIAEYAASGRVSTGTMEYAFSDARALSAGLPQVRAAFASGAISVGHVREIVHASVIVSEAVANGRADAEIIGLFESAVLVVAEKDTPARTRAHAREVAAALAGETVVERHRRAQDERCVTVRSVDDGLALLTAVLPEYLAVAIADRLTQLARGVIAGRNDREPVGDPAQAPFLDPIDDGENPIGLFDLPADHPARDDYAIFGTGTFTTDPLTDPTSAAIEHIPADERSMDQIRADLFTDLLLASDPSQAHGTGLDNITARIQVTVAATTLARTGTGTGNGASTGRGTNTRADTDARPAQLDGHGPLHPDIARTLAGRHTGWSRLFLDPTGLVTETDTYTPTEPMRRFLRARDQHCRFPGCRAPVHRCQIDHNHDHALGGPTSIDNLAHLCGTHHALKHPDIDNRHRWTARQRPDGTIDWISPLGHTRPDPPPRRVMFI